jgi:hypothetical protein
MYGIVQEIVLNVEKSDTDRHAGEITRWQVYYHFLHEYRKSGRKESMQTG